MSCDKFCIDSGMPKIGYAWVCRRIRPLGSVPKFLDFVLGIRACPNSVAWYCVGGFDRQTCFWFYKFINFYFWQSQNRNFRSPGVPYQVILVLNSGVVQTVKCFQNFWKAVRFHYYLNSRYILYRFVQIFFWMFLNLLEAWIKTNGIFGTE